MLMRDMLWKLRRRALGSFLLPNCIAKLQRCEASQRITEQLPQRRKRSEKKQELNRLGRLMLY
jgi:hypothetical protein